MKEKRLHIDAIIPDELYIQRDADRKLEEVIKRMSKPAYISVARQMGKTNLLLHAKRKLENLNNRYVYIDISNKFATAQDCFRYIIDQVVDSNEDIPEILEAGKTIKNQRSSNSSNPTQEYQEELRSILRAYKGNIIIFLDEVDDLRRHDFSDEIFAQIRKTYFVRVTYPVFNRLSYVLCGVIDPEQLIKNKDNSPFNIAIPIYLGDFTLVEANSLRAKANFPIADEVMDYIYSWLGGNPRMTFDILSKLEDEYLENHIITNELVDNVIYDFYLKTFKQSPIDHIRDMVTRHTDIRKSVFKLKRGNSHTLSDDEKNRLYLFGIVNSRINEESIKIKNKVIDLALSLEWLDKVELEKKGYYDLGIDKIINQEYETGIRLLKEFIQTSPNNSLVKTSNYYIGEAYFKLGKHELSNQYLVERPISKDISVETFYRQIYYTGINYWREKRYDLAIDCFDEIITDGSQSQSTISALANKGAVLFFLNKWEESEKTYHDALEFLQNSNEIIEEKGRLYTEICYRLGLLLSEKHDDKGAVEFYYSGLKYAKEIEKPLLLLTIDSFYKDQIDKRKEIHVEVANIILQNRLTYTTEEIIIQFNESMVSINLINLFEFGYLTLYHDLLLYTKEILNENKKELYKILFDIALVAIRGGDLFIGSRIFEAVLQESNVDVTSKIISYRSIGIILNKPESKKKSTQSFLRYVEFFEQSNSLESPIGLDDFTAFMELISHYRNQKQLPESYRIASIIEKRFSNNLSQELKAQTIIIFYFIMDYHNYSGLYEIGTIYAKRILQTIEDLNQFLNEANYANKQVVLQIKAIAVKVINDSISIDNHITPIKITREKGRNEWVKVKYKNGNEVLGKYKKFREDLINGDCVLLE